MNVKVNPVGSNQTEVTTGKGNVILFSYKTPVAAYMPGIGFMRTNVHYSVTTSRHINTWLRNNGAILETVAQVDPLFFDTL